MKPSGLLRKSVASKVGVDARAVGESSAPAPQFVAGYAVDGGQPSEPADLTLSLLFRTSQRLQTVLDGCFSEAGNDRARGCGAAVLRERRWNFGPGACRGLGQR